MPVFRFEDWPNSPPEVFSFTVFAVMIYPGDETLSNELRATFLTEFAFRQEGVLGRPDSGTLWRMLHARHAGRSAQQVLAQAEHVVERHGYLSGELVLLLYRLLHDRDARVIQGGVGQACYMLEQAAKSAHRTVVKTPIPRKTSKWFHAQVWKAYRSVAHLWAAHMLLSKDRRSVWTSVGWHRPGSHLFGDHQGFFTFLALAEHYRTFLTTHRPHASRGLPLLRPEETWTAPPFIPRVDVDVRDTVPLPEAYALARKSYRARRFRHR